MKQPVELFVDTFSFDMSVGQYLRLKKAVNAILERNGITANPVRNSVYGEYYNISGKTTKKNLMQCFHNIEFTMENRKIKNAVVKLSDKDVPEFRDYITYGISH